MNKESVFRVKDKLSPFISTAGWPLLATVLGLVVGGIIIFASGANPISVYGTVFEKSFFNPYYLMQTLLRSAPIIICSLSAAISWRAGYINLGVEGQMVCGGLAGIVCALYMPGPAWFVLTMSFIVSCLAGALYALIPTWAQHICGVSMVMSSLMLNYVANYLTAYIVGYPMKDPGSMVEAMQTAQIDESLRLLKLSSEGNFNIGFVFTILTVVLVYFVMNRTTFGYESKMGGLNPNFALYGGVNRVKVMYMTMMLSGALAGFAGFVEVFGCKYRFIANMFSSSSYAWTGLMASLVGTFNPIVSTIYSIFFAGLDVGGQALQRDYGLPLHIANIIRCTIMLFVSVNFMFRIAKNRADKKNNQGVGK